HPDAEVFCALLEFLQELRLDLLAFGGDRLPLDRDQLGVHEPPQRLLEHAQFFGQFKIHHASPTKMDAVGWAKARTQTLHTVRRSTRICPPCGLSIRPRSLWRRMVGKGARGRAFFEFSSWRLCPPYTIFDNHRQITRTSTATAPWPFGRTISGLISMSAIRAR